MFLFCQLNAQKYTYDKPYTTGFRYTLVHYITVLREDVIDTNVAS